MTTLTDFRAYGNVDLQVRQDTPSIGYSWGKTDYFYVDGTARSDGKDGTPYARFATTEHYADVEVAGWARMENEPAEARQGFQVHVRHQHNDCNLLVALLRKSHRAGVWIEDDYRPGGSVAKFAAGVEHHWKKGEAHQWRIRVMTDSVAAWCCGIKVASLTDRLLPLTGQIGFRLDGAKVSFGGIVVKEL